MRKLLTKFICFILTLATCVSFLGGCNLVSVDSERDMNQVVATIKISDDIPEADKIYKKDIIMAYINYGYYYQQTQGSTMGAVIESLLKQLINTRIYVQNAIIKFDSNQGIYAGMIQPGKESLDKWDVTRYLSEDDLIDANYNTYKDMNDFIDNYVEDKPGDKVQDSLFETVRTAPSGAKNAEKELTSAEKQAYVEKGIDNTGSRKKAYNEVIEILEANELLGDAYKGDIRDSEYFKETLNNYHESRLIEKFEKCVTDSARKTVTYEDLKNAFAERYNKQAEMDDNEFTEMLSSASVEDPVLVYNGKGTYGYVYNLLLGVSDEQDVDIKAIKTTDIGLREQERKEILENTVVKDLRSTWVLSGYDFDGEKFTGDYTFAKDAQNSLPFKGVTRLLNPIASGETEPEDYKAEYTVESVKEFTLDEFIEMMEEYVYGGTQESATSTNANVYKKVNADNVVSEYDAKINELLFAFSTDDGSLNTYKGYSAEPKPDAGKDETYVTEFANAARELLGIGASGEVVTAMGNNSYIMVATDYGYHIMFYSEVFDSSYGYDDLEEYLNANFTKESATWEEEFDLMLSGWEDWKDTKSFMYTLFNSISSTIVNNQFSNVQSEILDYAYDGTDHVVKYEDRYADLLG